jgi:hypothetical protein|tara:strand:- start:1695 stop:2534 length:840 start_codon:yes stop_codon:yes gene_type:complete
MSRGIVVLAQNNAKDDYVQQACLLAMSLAVTNTDTLISIITNDKVPKEYVKLFDQIIPIPFADDAAHEEWKISNRWKIYHASPYDETLVLDTDMLVLQDISLWWNFLNEYEVFFTSNVYTYRNDLVTSDYYRKVFTSNYLPNLYIGLHYFKKCDFAQEFYKWLELISNNWELFYTQYAKENFPLQSSMDVSAAIAAKILDCDDRITNNKVKFPSFTHMKPKIQNWSGDVQAWQDCVGVYINKACEIKIGNHKQSGILHYTENSFVTDEILERYRSKLHV